MPEPVASGPDPDADGPDADGPDADGPDADGPDADGPDADDVSEVTAARSGSAFAPPDAIPPSVPLEELRKEPHWLNLPNLLTFLRALLVPVILWLLAQDGPDANAARWWAFGIFVFAAATDSIDGWVARRWHGVTRWGQLADPIADKLLIIGALASLAAVGELPWWAVIVIVTREVAVTMLRVLLVRRHDLVMPASAWGKAKTISQVAAVTVYLYPGVDENLRLMLLGLAIIFTVWSGIEYAFRAGRLARATP